ncbi:MAG: hypothetical protein AABY90_07085 [Nitrospirota bacterium]
MSRTSLKIPVVANVDPLSSSITVEIRKRLQAAGVRIHLPQEVSLDLCASLVFVNDEMTLAVRKGDAEINDPVA